MKSHQLKCSNCFLHCWAMHEHWTTFNQFAVSIRRISSSFSSWCESCLKPISNDILTAHIHYSQKFQLQNVSTLNCLKNVIQTREDSLYLWRGNSLERFVVYNCSLYKSWSFITFLVKRCRYCKIWVVSIKCRFCLPQQMKQRDWTFAKSIRQYCAWTSNSIQKDACTAS